MSDDLQPFQHFALTLRQEAAELAKLYNADGETVANGLLHALALQLSMQGERVEESAQGFAEALVKLAVRYHDAVAGKIDDSQLPLSLQTPIS